MSTEAEGAPPGAPDEPTPEDIHHVVRSFYGALAAHTLGAAVRLGIIESIGDGHASAAQVAATCETESTATHRLLRTMAALYLLEETEQGNFRVAPAGTLLDSSRAESMAPMIRMFTNTMMVRSWEGLTDCIRTGESAFPKFFDENFFDYLERNPADAAEFNAVMSGASRSAADALPSHFEFGRFNTVVDVGGGDGTLLTTVLQRNPGIHGVLQDTVSGLSTAPEVMRQAGVEDRCDARPGDFFARVPEGGDLYLLKAILHDWRDEQCLTILGNIRSVIPDHGTLLIIEGVLPDRVDPMLRGAYLSDLNMLVNHGGVERMADEFAALCEKAGFGRPSITPLPLPGDISLIEARPA